MSDEESRPSDSSSWKNFIQEGIVALAVTAVFWLPFLVIVVAVFCDGVFGTKIVETFKNARP